MSKSLQPCFVDVRMELDRLGGPRMGTLHITDIDCVTLAYVRCEFAPFDSLVDAATWWIREVRKRVPVRPG